MPDGRPLTIREVISGLEAVARVLDGGLDATVVIGLCHQETTEISEMLEVDTMTWIVQGALDGRSVAYIQGHPHDDAAEGRETFLRAATADVDDELRELGNGE